MLVNAYEYLFYKLYCWSVKINGEHFGYFKVHSCMMLSLVQLTNIFLIYITMDILLFAVVPNMSMTAAIVLIVLTAGFNYAYFSYNNRYKRVLDRYKNENPVSAKRGNVLVAAYVVGSFVLVVASGFFGIYIRNP